MQEKITKKKVRIGKGKIRIGKEKKAEITKPIITGKEKSFEAILSPIRQTKTFRGIKIRERSISSVLTPNVLTEKGKKLQIEPISIKERKYVPGKKIIFNTATPEKVAVEKAELSCPVAPYHAKRRFYRSKVRKRDYYLEHPEIVRRDNSLASNVPRIVEKKPQRINVREDLNLIPKPISVIVPSREITETTEEEGKSEEEKIDEKEIPDFFKLLSGEGVEKIAGGQPVCIIVQEGGEEYEELIASLCRDIFREKKGGKPKPIYRDSIEDLCNEFETWVEERVIVAKKVEKSSKGLIQILKGFFSQGIGFLILVSSNPLELERKIRKEEGSADVIILNSIQGMEEEKRDKLLSSIRGAESPIQRESLGEEFKRSNDEFDKRAKRYLDNVPPELSKNRDRLCACSPDDPDQASDLHSAMKAFVWMYEWKKSGKRISPDLETDRGVDVKMNGRNYEVETLFGSGDVEAKLAEKVRKYAEGGYIGQKIYFVMRNLDILRNLPLLWKFRNERRKEGCEVEFFGLDFDREIPVPLREFKELLKSLLE